MSEFILITPKFIVTKDGCWGRDLLNSLTEFCEDHDKQFGCYPMEYEYEGVVYHYDDFKDLIGR